MEIGNDDNVCRICLKRQDTLFSLYRNLHGASPYQKLVRRTNLRIELNDAGPSSICSQCLIDLDTTVSFLDRCEQSNQALMAMVQQIEPKVSITSSNLKIVCPNKFDDETWIETEPITRDGPPIVNTKPRLNKVNKDDVKSTANTLVAAHRCPDCNSKKRCAHWTPPNIYSCSYCDKTFNKKYNLQIHHARHAGSRPWACATCGAGQLTAALAARHCRARARRACPAPGCGKAFTTNSNLRIHMRSHTGERPFECHDCGKGFTSKKTLKDHIRIHTGEKPYMCPVCGARFTSNRVGAHLASHARGAAQHACPRAACARRFPSAAALRSHARTHASARPFACALCPTTYKFKQSLNRHVRKRHGVSAVHTNHLVTT